MGSEKYILLDFAKYLSFLKSAKEQQSCECLDQISGRRDFVLILLQKCSIKTSFW